MPWHLDRHIDAGRLPPVLAQIEPVVCMPFDAFGLGCVVTDLEDGGLTLSVRHVGGSKMQITLAAILRRQLDLTLPGHYAIDLHELGMPGAHIHVQTMGARHA